MDEVLKLAGSFGAGVRVERYASGVRSADITIGYHTITDELFAFAQAIEAAALERAAKVCDRHVVRAADWDSSYFDQAAEQCAISIRALSPPQPESQPDPVCKTCGGNLIVPDRDKGPNEWKDCPDCANQQAVVRCACKSKGPVCDKPFRQHPNIIGGGGCCYNAVPEDFCGHDRACHQQPKEGDKP